MFESLDYKLLISLYATLMSSYVFYRSQVRRAAFSFRINDESVAAKLKLRASSISGPEIFVEKLLLLDQYGAKVGEIDVLKFLRPYEVFEETFEERRIPNRNFSRVSVLASGKVYLAKPMI